MARQSPQPEAARRAQLLDAAAAVLLRGGHAALTMDAVAAEAAVAKGTVYLYFGSKQALLDGLRTRLAADMVAATQAVLSAPDRSWTARLEGLVAAWLRFDAAHLPLFHAVFHEGPQGGGPDAGLEPCLRALETVLRGGKQAGEFRVDSVRSTARFLLAGYVGACLPSGPVTGPAHQGHSAEPSSPGPALSLSGRALQRQIRELQALFRRTVGAPEP